MKSQNQTRMPVKSSNKSKDVITWLKRKRIALLILFFILTIPLIFVAWIYVSLSGGVEGIVSDLKPAPNPKSADIISKRTAARESINESFTDLALEPGFTSYAESTHDHCYEGQNNYKLRDGYAHRCTLRLTKYYGFSDDFRSKMIGFEQSILSKGWVQPYSSSKSLKDIMEQ